MDNIQRVLDWLHTGLNRPKKPIEIPNKEDSKLWESLAKEELNETIEAIKNEDKDELMDGVVDQFYILCNLMYFTNITAEDFQKYFNRVSKSNWSKYCKSEDEAIVTVEKYGNGTHPDKLGEFINTYYVKSGTWFIVKRTVDNKILKSYLYKKP